MHLSFYVYGTKHSLTDLDYPNQHFLRYFRDSLNLKQNVLEYGVDDKTLDKCVYLVYSELLLSRHFLTFCCVNARLPVLSMLNRIESFYSDLDMMQLSNYFAAQEKYFSQDFVDTDDIVYLYDNKSFSMDSFKQSMSYKMFEQKSYEIWQSKIKHKKLNDMNQLFIDK